jgi:hypothetical protein
VTISEITDFLNGSRDMFDVANRREPGARKGKIGRTWIEKMTFRSRVEVSLKLDVRGLDIGGKSRLVVGD